MPTGTCVGGPMDGESYTGGGTRGVVFQDTDGQRHTYAWDAGSGTFRYMMVVVDLSGEARPFSEEQWELADLP